jgi:hypothetical protein
MGPLQEDHFDIGAHFHHHILHDDATGNTYFVDGLEAASLSTRAAPGHASMGGMAAIGLGPTRVRWVVQNSTKAPRHTPPFRCASYLAIVSHLALQSLSPRPGPCAKQSIELRSTQVDQETPTHHPSESPTPGPSSPPHHLTQCPP